MPRRVWIPEQLRNGPFSVEEAAAAGLTPDHLRSSAWIALGVGMYVWAKLGATPRIRLAAVLKRIPDAVFCGVTAAWLHGLETEPCDPIEVAVAAPTKLSRLGGVRLRRIHLQTHECVLINGLPVTSPLRTLGDLAHALSLTEAVVVADTALRHGVVTLDELQQYAESRRGKWGSARMHRVAQEAEPKSESQMESRMRMLLIEDGQGRPVAQHRVHLDGEYLGAVDLVYPEEGVGVEYDGGTHKLTLVENNRRQNRLMGAGITLLRFTASDYYGRPETILAQVRDARARARARETEKARIVTNPGFHHGRPSRFVTKTALTREAAPRVAGC